MLYSACALSNSPPNTTMTPANDLINSLRNDWQAETNGSTACGGYYLPPKFDSELENTKISFDHGSLTLIGTSTIYGNVEIIQPDKHLFAERLSLERDASGTISRIDANGDVTLEQPGVRLIGDSAKLEMAAATGVMHNANYRLYDQHARGQATQIDTGKYIPTTLLDANYTTCNPGSNLWTMNSRKVVIDQESGRGSAYLSLIHI